MSYIKYMRNNLIGKMMKRLKQNTKGKNKEIEENFKEKNEEFELYLGDQDLNLEDLFKENDFEHIEMATNFIKPRYFSGELDEDLTEWVKQFNQAAESNEWVNNDVANNQKT